MKYLFNFFENKRIFNARPNFNVVFPDQFAVWSSVLYFGRTVQIYQFPVEIDNLTTFEHLIECFAVSFFAFTDQRCCLLLFGNVVDNSINKCFIADTYRVRKNFYISDIAICPPGFCEQMFLLLSCYSLRLGICLLITGKIKVVYLFTTHFIMSEAVIGTGRRIGIFNFSSDWIYKNNDGVIIVEECFVVSFTFDKFGFGLP
ncbi:hypothetical protein SDC9_161499 [bioreactor metagenome]|uniref:Uncharacterized protein n=1 Tax=bioreactor metagenome TaxID=1076179 RepID=A0A645FPQ7_9ZZZZ